MRGYSSRRALVWRRGELLVSGLVGVLLGRAWSAAAQRPAKLAVAQRVSELEQPSQDTNRVIAGASHELRTPLNAIIGFADLMHDEQLGPISSEHRECLEDIRGSARQLLDLINDLLALTRMESGQAGLDPQATDPVQVASESVDLLRSLAAERDVGLRLEADTVGTAWLDCERLGYVLRTYLAHAIKSSPRGEEVLLVVRRLGDELVIEVSDAGPRIDPGEQHRAFEQPTRRRDRSSTIGLAVTKRIVAAQLGTVGARSVSGQGNTFTVRLPVPSWGTVPAGAPANQAAAA